MRTASQVISYLFHPVFMPSFGLLMIYLFNDEISNYNMQSNNVDYMMNMIKMILFVSIIIIMVSLILSRVGVVSSIEAEETSDRLKLYTVALTCYGMIYYALGRVDLQQIYHPSVFDSYFGALIAIALCIIITPFYKISAHMIGIAGVVGILYAIGTLTFSGNSSLVIALIILCGLIGTARMLREAHTLDQVVSGFFVGFLCTFLSISNSWSIY